jgi:hypothetical protein
MSAGGASHNKSIQKVAFSVPSSKSQSSGVKRRFNSKVYDMPQSQYEQHLKKTKKRTKVNSYLQSEDENNATEYEEINLPLAKNDPLSTGYLQNLERKKQIVFGSRRPSSS